MKPHKKIKLDFIDKCDVGENEESSSNSALCAPSTSSDNSNELIPLAGRIDTIQMINFMCHTNLEVKFNERVTFVTGLNGSGKSTIMAALIVVLGGSAYTTGRGKGLTDFIKKGERWAKVVLTLINEGKNAYKTDVYGNKIILIRDLSLKSGNTYTCKSKSGKIISKRRNEIDRICAALDIQIKNPICILNQDVSRTFLATSDGSSRYEMFMKATHLENLQFLYSTVIALLDWAKNKLEKKKKKVAEAKEDLKQLKEKLEFFVSLQKYVHERKFLENEFLWSLVKAEEKEIEDLKSKRSEGKKKMESFEEFRENFEKTMDELQGKIKKYSQKLLACERGEDDKLQNSRRKKNLEQMIQNIEREMDEIDERIHDLVCKKSRLEIDVSSTRKHIEDLKRVPGESAISALPIEKQISMLSNRLEYVKQDIVLMEQEKEKELKNKVHYRLHLGDLRMELAEMELLKRRHEMFKKDVVYEESLRNASVSIVEPMTEKLENLIDQAMEKKKFQIRPVGPCYKYVQLTNIKWARAVESIIGGLMNSYICDNHADFQVLSEIMRKVCRGRSPHIIISKFPRRRYKVSVSGFCTILDVLEISSDVVFNNFVDQARIETILLFNTDAEASAMMSRVRKVPENLRMGVTLQCDIYYPAPNYRTYHGNPNRPLKYFDCAARSHDVIAKAEAELNAALLQMERKNLEIKEMAKKNQKNMDLLRITDGKLKVLKENEKDLEKKIEELKEQQLALPLEDNALLNDLEILENKVNKIRESLKSEKLKKKESFQRKEILMEKLKSNLKNEERWESEHSETKDKLDKFKCSLTETIQKRDNMQKDYEEMKVELHRYETELKQHKNLLKEKMEAAMEVHEERIDTDRSPAEIETLLEKCRNGLKLAAENSGNVKRMGIEFERKSKKYTKTKSDIERLELIIEALSGIARSKKKKLKSYHLEIANVVSFYFQSFLKMRGFNAELKFHFSQETLEIEVTEASGLKRTDTKTLSGGERSYLMVSFILAIWRTVEMPFYFLDEFDVFMDKMNRKVIMDLLTWHGENEKGKQFIFITPQEVSSIRTSDIVSIYRLPDPRRMCKEPISP